MSVFTSTEPQTVGAGLAAMPRVNLMPPEIAERRRFRQVQMGLGATVVAAVAVVGLLFVSAGNSVTEAQSELEAAESRETVLQAQVAEFAQVEQIYAQAAAAQQMLTDAMGQEVRYSRFLNDLSLTIPANTWLTTISYDQSPAAQASLVGGTVPALGVVTVEGVAFEHDDVAAWLDSNARQAGYASPYLTSSEVDLIGDRAVVVFSSTVVLSQDALTNAYTTTPAGG